MRCLRAARTLLLEARDDYHHTTVEWQRANTAQAVMILDLDRLFALSLQFDAFDAKRRAARKERAA